MTARRTRLGAVFVTAGALAALLCGCGSPGAPAASATSSAVQADPSSQPDPGRAGPGDAVDPVTATGIQDAVTGAQSFLDQLDHEMSTDSADVS